MMPSEPGRARTAKVATGLNNAHDQQAFIERLTETILWCRGAGSLLQPRTSLRTFNPVQSALSSQHHQVYSVSLQRARRLWVSGKRDHSSIVGLCGGRLLAYFPDDNLFDGMAEQVSTGFFDVNNIPPYDTWVWMVRNVRAFEYADGAKGEIEANYLIAWVPPDFIPISTAGIDANPEGCILWLDTLDDEFVRSLRRMSFFQGTPFGAS
jgi:hypothetical protein